MSAPGVQLSRFLARPTRVMVPRGRKRRDSALVGARVPGVRRPGDKGAGELATGWARGHNRRRRARWGPREQPRRAEPSLAGTGRRGRWFPREGGTALRPLGGFGLRPGGGVVVRCSQGRGRAALCLPGGGEEWAQPAGAPASCPWQMASLSGCLPVCQGAGEMMSPRRTWNQSEGTFLASFCHSGFLDRLCFVLRG